MQNVQLPITHIKQDVNLCVPTCAAMALAFYNDPQTPQSLKALAVAAQAADNNFDGTYFRDLVRGMATLNYHWFEKCYAINRSGFRQGLADIIKALNQQRPVLVDLNLPPIGHTVLAIGYDATLEHLILLDPNREAPGLHTMPYEEFREVWQSLTASVRAAIYTAPRHEQKARRLFYWFKGQR